MEDVRGILYRTVLFASMLLGAWFRQNDSTYRNKLSKWHFALVPCLFGGYLALKFIFTKKPTLGLFQITTPICIFVLLYFILRLFAGLDKSFGKMPAPVRRCIDFLAAMTLEIYVVQGEIIDRIRSVFGFPMNWLALTGCILLAATVLHFICDIIMKLSGFVGKKIKDSLK